LRGHEGQPLVIQDVGGKPMMFIESGWPNIVQALDLSDPDHPQQLWHYNKTSGRDESAVPRACCDTVNRGLSYADGKLVFGTLDGFVIALDAVTGKEIWVVKHAHPAQGETITPAPIIANDKVIIGFGGDEFAARGRVTAYALADGKKVWECHSTGSDKDVCLTPNTNKKHPEYGKAGKDLGISTFPGDEWKRGGGAAWGWYAYDPALHLVYYGTGNPGLWSPQYRCAEPLTQANCNSGKFDNKWSMSIFARNVDTGEAEWVYQMTPFDQWDYDGVNEVVLVDMEVDGKMHKCLVHCLCSGPHRRHSSACQQVRHHELGGEGRFEDRPSGQGPRAFPAAGGRQYSGLPLRDGRQGPAAGGGRSDRSHQFLRADQQLVHGG
jgi:PQQ-dependent dehydrogenase (methanol/ethanol family)